MAVSKQSIRQTLGLYSGLGFNVETTSGGSATTAVSTNMIDYFDSDDEPINRWCWPIDTPSAVARRISDFTQSTGTVTVGTGFGATPGTTSTIEIWKINPALVDEAIKRTIEAIYPRLFLPYRNETLVTGNWLRDGNFEEWSSSSALTFYSGSASATLARTSTAALTLYGAYSMKVTAGAATQYAYQSDAEAPNLLDLGGHTITFRCHVYTDTASNARLQIVTTDKDGNSVTTNSSYHDGDSRWHLLEIENLDLPDDLRAIEFRYTATVNGADSYFDNSRVTGPSTRGIYLPRTGFKDLQSVAIQTKGGRGSSDEDFDPCDDVAINRNYRGLNGCWIEDDGTDKVLQFPVSVPNKYSLLLKGGQLLTVPTDDTTASVELNSPETEYLIAESLVRLYMMIRNGLPGLDTERMVEERGRWLREADRLKRKHMMLLPPSNMAAR